MELWFRWTADASSALDEESNAVFPSTPAVLQPFLLGRSSHAHQRVGPAPEHQPLQTANFPSIPSLLCREDPLPQPLYVPLD